MMGTVTTRRLVAALALAWPLAVAANNPPAVQLESVRSRITELESRLAALTAASADVGRERERLAAERELAEARVHENELVLVGAKEELERIRSEVDRLAASLASRREVLKRHLEMVELLGRPGPLQLMFDAAGHGDLERAVTTVAVLTAGQARLLQEYSELRVEHATRLAALSQILEEVKREAGELARRRQELERTRRRVDARLATLTRSRNAADQELADLRERAAGLERLMGVLAERERFTGSDDIRRYRGALPWPAQARVVRGFGRHYLPKYATYTVCNGLRLDVGSGAPVKAVFPGVVAFARHFKGYGNMVVVDHGRGVYSLVAGLATIHVRVGQRVSMGSRLGLAAPPAEDGNLYFEIRVAEKPHDPRRWLQLEEVE